MKSTVIPPILVVFDLNALMTGKTQDWKTYSRVGECYLPQVLYKELDFLAGRAEEPERERVAKEFSRFFSKSGWHLTSARASHPSLKPAAGAATSKQARLLVATAQCVYGLSQEETDKLVVFVSNTQPLLQRMQSLGAQNLCSINSTDLLQWARSGERPAEITQQMQSLQKASAASPSPPIQEKNRDRTVAKRSSSKMPATAPPKKSTSDAVRSRAKSTSAAKEGYAPKAESYRDKSEPVYGRRPLPTLTNVKSSKFGFFASSIYLAIAAIALTAAVGILWRAIQPASFNPFWHRNIEPMLPSQIRGLVK